MGTIDRRLAADLRNRLALGRAVETGTFRGVTARSLAAQFDSVVTIELSASLHEQASARLRDLPQVEAVHGDSVEVLDAIARCGIPTLFFLDGHWSGGNTEGVENECPVLEEIAAIGAGHPADCMIIDDARLFTASPPPPHDPEQWPTITEVFDAIRSQRPDHLVTLLADQVIAVPPQAKPVIDSYGASIQGRRADVRSRALSMIAGMRSRAGRW
ncbi:MAG TPA: hypothetical protein VG147_05670 [Solirubrobacteraceae bacterium]|jgi:hypothetical protein|nr:hypothetical protein [Solirubrobacteraceae bacterium]